MQLRPLGDSHLLVTPIGLGLAALGRPGYINLGHADDIGDDRAVDDLRRRTFDVLDAAWDAGVRYVDAARSYGRAEEFLAAWLQDRGRTPDAPTVGSKWGYTYTADWRPDAETHEVKEHSLDQFRRQFAETRGLLGAHLDLYQIHSATLDSGVLDDAAVLDALAELADEGVVVGLTVSGPQQADTIRRALTVDVEGINPFRVVQATWNVLETSVAPALAEAADAGWGVIIKEAVANGRLTERGDAASATELARLRALAQARGVPLDAVALAAVLAQPWVATVLSGAATVAQLQSNLAAADLDLDAGALADLEDLAEEPDAYWATRSDLPWT